MSVHMGTENDLKSVMQKKGMKVSFSLVLFLAKLIKFPFIILLLLFIVSIFYYFMKLNALMQGELRPGEPNDMMYVKFADQFLAKAQYDNALFYIEQALAMNPNCTVYTINSNNHD